VKKSSKTGSRWPLRIKVYYVGPFRLVKIVTREAKNPVSARLMAGSIKMGTKLNGSKYQAERVEVEVFINERWKPFLCYDRAVRGMRVHRDTVFKPKSI
jgi:hypothetical protein